MNAFVVRLQEGNGCFLSVFTVSCQSPNLKSYTHNTIQSSVLYYSFFLLYRGDIMVYYLCPQKNPKEISYSQKNTREQQQSQKSTFNFFLTTLLQSEKHNYKIKVRKIYKTKKHSSHKKLTNQMVVSIPQALCYS